MTVALANDRSVQGSLHWVQPSDSSSGLLRSADSARLVLTRNVPAIFRQRWFQAVQTATDNQGVADARGEPPSEAAVTTFSPPETVQSLLPSQLEGSLVSASNITGSDRPRPAKDLSVAPDSPSTLVGTTTVSKNPHPSESASALRRLGKVKSNEIDEMQSTDQPGKRGDQGLNDGDSLRHLSASLGDAVAAPAQHSKTADSVRYGSRAAAAKNGPEHACFTVMQRAQRDSFSPGSELIDGAGEQTSRAEDVAARVNALENTQSDTLPQASSNSDHSNRSVGSAAAPETHLANPAVQLSLVPQKDSREGTQSTSAFQVLDFGAAPARPLQRIFGERVSGSDAVGNLEKRIFGSEQSFHTVAMTQQVPIGIRETCAETSTTLHGALNAGRLDPFSAIDSHASPATSWLYAGTQRAEAGFTDPILGWVAVRAESHGDGVHAAIVASSAEGVSSVHDHLAGLDRHLADRHIPVASVTVTAEGGHGGFPHHAGQRGHNAYQAAASAMIQPVARLELQGGNLRAAEGGGATPTQLSNGIGTYISVCA